MEHIRSRTHAEYHIVLIGSKGKCFAMNRRSHSVIELDRIRNIINIDHENFITERIGRRSRSELDSENHTGDLRDFHPAVRPRNHVV